MQKIIILLLLTFSFSQDCPDTEVELWGTTYNIATTTELILNNQGLTDEIPLEIGCLTNLTVLRLESNSLTGSIPSEIGDLTNLTDLVLSYNSLTGSIPSEIGNLTNLYSIQLHENQLSGPIPSEIGNLTNLNYLYLYNNDFTGNIPSEFGNLINIKKLWLSENQLSGSITNFEIVGLINLEDLNLSNNELTNSISTSIGNLTSMTYLNLSNNSLSGEIPDEILNLINLEYLYLQDNNLSGEIPDICSLPSLIFEGDPNDAWGYTDISDNQLCPPYPNCITGDNLNQDISNCSSLSNIDELVYEYNLFQNYPNPFNPNTTIAYNVSKFSNVKISIYNISSQLVDVIEDKMHAPGQYNINWNAEGYTSGVYFIKLIADEFVDTQKIMLIK